MLMLRAGMLRATYNALPPCRASHCRPVGGGVRSFARLFSSGVRGGVVVPLRRPAALLASLQAARRPASASMLALGAAWTCGWSSAALTEGEGETNPMTGESDSKLPDPDDKEEIEEALNCPCIDGMKEGPCGDAFVVAYRCFLESKAEERGSDCLEQFQGMQACFVEHADYYEKKDEDAKAAAAAAEEEEANKPEWQKKLDEEKKKSGVWA